MSEIISLSEFARRLGVGEKTIRDGIKNGKLVKGVIQNKSGKSKIDYEVALAEALDSGLGQKVLATKEPETRIKAVSKNIEKKAVKIKIEDGEGSEGLLSYFDAMTAEKNYKAEKSRLELLEKQKQLLPADVVYRQLFVFGQEVRDALQGIPNQIAAEVCDAGGNINKVTIIMAKAILDVLEKLNKLEKKEVV
jgi:hypothetical protein